MKKTKNAPRSKAKTPKPKLRKLPLSTHPIQGHASGIVDLVHSALAKAGVQGLMVRAVHFSNADSSQSSCPPNQHREFVCRTGPGGEQVCEWECVPN
jgi:hypothetical protein